MDNNSEKRIGIEMSSEIAQGKYSNLTIISHSKSEFILDFASMLPNVPKASVVSRIICTPENAKRLLAALGDNIQKYEAHFGPINPDSQPSGNTINLADFTHTNNGSNS